MTDPTIRSFDAWANPDGTWTVRFMDGHGSTHDVVFASREALASVARQFLAELEPKVATVGHPERS